MFTTEEKREHQKQATQRWRERNPDKVQAANSKPRKRLYEAEKVKVWRNARLQKAGYKERVNGIANARATAIREWISKYKADIGCIDCGFKDPRALDFDHLDGTIKAINVSNAKSIEQAKREIAKCAVRCANCHRIVTHQRFRQARK